MKSDESSNFNANGCAVERSIGKSYTVFIPTSKKDSKSIDTNAVVKHLAQQFDYVNASRVEHCSTPKEEKCEWGIRAEALRKDRENSEQEYTDMAFVLKIVHDNIGKPDRVRFLDVKDDITIYSWKCK